MASKTQVTKRRRKNRKAKLAKNRSRATKKNLRKLKAKGFTIA